MTKLEMFGCHVQQYVHHQRSEQAQTLQSKCAAWWWRWWVQHALQPHTLRNVHAVRSWWAPCKIKRFLRQVWSHAAEQDVERAGTTELLLYKISVNVLSFVRDCKAEVLVNGVGMLWYLIAHVSDFTTTGKNRPPSLQGKYLLQALQPFIHPSVNLQLIKQVITLLRDDDDDVLSGGELYSYLLGLVVFSSGLVLGVVLHHFVYPCIMQKISNCFNRAKKKNLSVLSVIRPLQRRILLNLSSWKCLQSAVRGVLTWSSTHFHTAMRDDQREEVLHYFIQSSSSSYSIFLLYSDTKVVAF